MVAALRELFARSRQPSHEDKEAAVHVLASIIEQALSIGHAHATDEAHERAVAWGGMFQNVLSSAWDIVSNFVGRIANWFSAHPNATEEEVVEEVESLADRVAGFEVAAAIESEVLRELTFAGVKMARSIAQPGACDDCLTKAARGPVPINDFVPPPYHQYCQCSSAPADEEE